MNVFNHYAHVILVADVSLIRLLAEVNITTTFLIELLNMHLIPLMKLITLNN